MEKALELINQLKKEGLIKDYAICGAIAISYYTEPVLSLDLDILFMPLEMDGLISLKEIYNWFSERGYGPEDEFIVVEDIPIQFVPTDEGLLGEAITSVREEKYGDVKTRILVPEYLVAIMVKLMRQKDRERLVGFLGNVKLDKDLLNDILERHGLADKFRKFTKERGLDNV